MRRLLLLGVVLVVSAAILAACVSDPVAEPAEPVALDLKMTDAFTYVGGGLEVAQPFFEGGFVKNRLADNFPLLKDRYPRAEWSRRQL